MRRRRNVNTKSLERKRKDDGGKLVIFAQIKAKTETEREETDNITNKQE